MHCPKKPSAMGTEFDDLSLNWAKGSIQQWNRIVFFNITRVPFPEHIYDLSNVAPGSGEDPNWSVCLALP